MFINGAISFLSAWRNIEQSHPSLVQDILSALGAIDREQMSEETTRNRASRDSTESGLEERHSTSPHELGLAITQEFSIRDWKTNIRSLRSGNRYARLMTIDALKEGVGLTLCLGKTAFLESKLFVGFPYLTQSKVFHTAVVLVPMASLARHMPSGLNTFEAIDDMLAEMPPLPLKYPFVILGFSDSKSSIAITELSSELDTFLLESVGLSLDQMALLNEGPSYDFKVTLPDNKKLAQEICAFANLSGGGLILLGVNKDGAPVGLPKGKTLDDDQLRITNVINDACIPKPRFEFHVFDNPENHDLSIVVISIHEIERKPCMTREKVYIRSGPSARVAGPDEIRRLILG